MIRARYFCIDCRRRWVRFSRHSMTSERPCIYCGGTARV